VSDVTLGLSLEVISGVHKRQENNLKYLVGSRPRTLRDLMDVVAAARLLGYGFETRREHGCLSLVSVVCYHVEVPATD
jgi:hypothetical protein